MTDWQDVIVGDRMVVDDEFSSRVEGSRFSRQEWGLVMTATTFEIEDAGDEEAARIVADTSQLPAVLPELEKVASMGPMGQQREESSGGGGVLDSVFDALGFGGGAGGSGVDEEKLEDAERLVAAYAEELQAHLEAEGRWQEVRAAAVDEAE